MPCPSLKHYERHGAYEAHQPRTFRKNTVGDYHIPRTWTLALRPLLDTGIGLRAGIGQETIAAMYSMSIADPRQLCRGITEATVMSREFLRLTRR